MTTARAVCEAIDADLSSWWDKVAMWLDVFTELDLLENGRDDRPGRAHRLLARTVGDDGTTQPVSYMRISEIRTPRPFKMPDTKILRDSFELAGARIELPDAWSYLREARSWLNNGETRRAVIDACTAAEIALAKQVRELLPCATDKEIQQQIRECEGVAGVAEFVVSNGGETLSKRRVAGQLAGPRNNAAHAGIKPDHETAQAAFKTAARIVEFAIPLDSLAGLSAQPATEKNSAKTEDS